MLHHTQYVSAVSLIGELCVTAQGVRVIERIVSDNETVAYFVFTCIVSHKQTVKVHHTSNS